MKKSFLITLAAVSSVALIGCSSSSDDNNGGQGGGETTINLTSATASSLGSNDTFVGVKVSVEGTKTVDGKEGAIAPTDTTLSLTCGEGNIIDDAKDHVAILKTNLNDQCKLSVKAGETTKEVELDKTEGNYVNLPKVEVKQDEEVVTAGINLTKTKENSTAPIEYTVTGKEAGQLVAEEGNVDAGKGENDLDATKFAITADESLTTPKTIFAKGTANNQFKLDLGQADATVNGNVTIQYDSKAVIPATVPVEITVEGSSTSPETPAAPAVEYLTDTVDTTTAIVVKITNIPDGVTVDKITCDPFNSDKNVVKATAKDGNTLLVGAKVADLAASGNNVPCKIGEDQARATAPSVTINFDDAKSKLVPAISLEDTTKQALNIQQLANGTVYKVKATFAQGLQSYNDTLAKTAFAEIAQITHVVTAKQDLSGKEATTIAVNENKEEANPAADSAACTTANLKGNGCEFALKAVAAGKANLVFNGADANPSTNKKYVFAATVK